ncbi:MAG: BatD family protein, partial [Gemmatimonadetes bacterium]|nr:BatD family protein [Gemmatimonadota bacterium]
ASQGVNFRAAVNRDSVYVGEQVTYQVGVFLDDDTRHRLRRNPEFTPPEPRAMLAYDLPSPPGPTAVRTANGRRYEVHVFQRALFPISPGPAMVPPARLAYALPLSNSFFAREERRTARADSLTVQVRPLPAADRPPEGTERLSIAPRPV